MPVASDNPVYYAGKVSIGKTDSLRHIRNFLRTYRPPAITKTEIKEVKVRDTRVENQLQTTIDNCRRENEGLISQATVAKDRQAKTRSTNIWLWIVCGLLFSGHVYNILSKKLPV